MKRLLQSILGCISMLSAVAQNSFTPGNLVVLQTSGTASKASSAVTLKEFTTSGTPGIVVPVPTTGPTPFQSAGIFGGSEGFLTTSTDGKYLVLGGYATSAGIADITASSASSVPRAVGLVYPSGFYLQFAKSNTFFSANDIRGAISDGTNFWASGASNASVDGIDYFGPGTPAALATGSNPPKAYGMRIFNGQLYFSTQKAGPTNTTSQLGIFALGTGLPVSGTPVVTQIINTGTVIPEDFSINPAENICYIAINLNTSAGGIQKWIKTGSVWSLAYTLGTGIANTGAYGLVVDYSGTFPVIYATTFDAAGNRVIKITDNGSGATAITIVAATANVYYKGISFAPAVTGTPIVNLSISKDTASEAGASVITVTANTSAPVSGSQSVTLSISGTGITTGDYSLSGTTITIPAGATSGSVTFTIADDILGEGTETATLTIASPSAGIALGMRTTQQITIADNDGNNHPTIVIDASTTNFIDGGVAVASPFKLSGVINDPTDPEVTQGLNFMVNDLETPASGLTVWAVSSNTTVVPVANVTITGTGALRNVRIAPAGIGFSNITIKVSDGIDTTAYIINYAASAASATPANTVWHTGMSDASDAIPQNEDYYMSADDELNVLNVYSRSASGLPVKSYNYTSNLSLPNPGNPEVDIEAAAVSSAYPGRTYWLGSMSNGKSPFDNKPNRDRIFATTYSGTGAATTFSFVGYAALRSSLLLWGDANGYSFSASAAAGVDSKSPAGFAAEGMVMGPDNTTLYIGLRAPLVPTTARTKAVIAPIANFETWFNNGAPAGSPVYGSPIELDLGGRGIRDIIRLSNGTYVIVAGNPAGDPLISAIYKWSGNTTDAPILVPASVAGVLNMEGVMPVNTSGDLSLSSLQVITDQGDDVFYGEGTVAKDFGDLIYRKFRSDIVTGIDLSYPKLMVQGNAVNVTNGGTTTSTTNNTDLGGVTYGTTTTKTFVLRNTGSGTLSVSFINISGAHAGDFTLPGATSFPVDIAANGTYSLTVQFAPQGIGARNATMNIVSNDADVAAYSFAVRGTGLCNYPASFTVTGGGNMCAGAAGLALSLNSSAAGVNYQLYNAATVVGSSVAGTGSSINFGTFTTAGIYSVQATDAVTGCTSAMAGAATIVVNPLPVVYNVTGGGNYCSGGAGAAVGLNNSQTGISYQLYNGSSALGSAVAGSGTPVTFGNVTTAATYTVQATNATTGCTSAMTGNAFVTINPLPFVYNVSGGGNYCSGGTGLPVGLASSQAGISYSLYNGATVVTSLSGTGSALSFGVFTASGVYTVSAGNAATGCVNDMFGNAQVLINPLPVTYAVTGGGNYCAGGTGVHTGLGGSSSGINYTLYNGTTSISTLSGTDMPLDFGLLITTGTYTVRATDAATLCSADMPGLATVATIPTVTPSVTVSPAPGAQVCQGTMVTFLSSAVNGGTAPAYQWRVNGTAIAAATASGYTYTPANGDVVSVKLASNAVCRSIDSVTTSMTMTVNPYVLPMASLMAVPGNILCEGNPVTITAAITNGGATPSYTWIKNSVVVGTGSSYAYTPVNGDLIVMSLTSSKPCLTVATVASNSVHMQIWPHYAPVVALDAAPGLTITHGRPLTLSARVASAGPTPAYKWLKNGIVIPGATDSAYTSSSYELNDSVSCVVTGSGPCATSGATYAIIKVNTLGISNAAQADGFSIHPNPNNGTFTISGKTADQLLEISVVNMLGQNVYSGTIMPQNGTVNEAVALSNTLPGGTYLLSIHSQSVTSGFRIEVSR